MSEQKPKKKTYTDALKTVMSAFPQMPPEKAAAFLPMVAQSAAIVYAADKITNAILRGAGEISWAIRPDEEADK